ncbi:hypothetical protein GF359_00910 [candidate division WOR-3 bacterium]|uniref:Uncharacterized protein n=1 Tax=candidate division WOR-3 bacterium TaxID=2052148 RepID=A0A9D5K7H3_UNCW3|nr:hypothetical protein [candidate division WOR-3 bacterium]MBD3363753.1 hypothetical protein [candidate division WOR-3 bacterium]
MDTRKPTSNEIVRSLMALGFRVTGVRKRQTVLENGRSRVSVPLRLGSKRRELQLKKQLETYFYQASDLTNNLHVEKVKQWLFPSG